MESSGMDSPHAEHCMVQPHLMCADEPPKGFLHRVNEEGHMDSPLFNPERQSRSPASWSAFRRTWPISEGSFAQAMPAARKASNFSSAVPFPPEMMAPA